METRRVGQEAEGQVENVDRSLCCGFHGRDGRDRVSRLRMGWFDFSGLWGAGASLIVWHLALG